jgi:twitching motility protein PilT
MAAPSPEEDALNAQLPKLGDLIFKLLNEDKNITDVHCASDEVLRVRRASNDWVVPKDGDGQPIEVSHKQIVALVNGIYEREEAPYLYATDSHGHRIKGQFRKPAWMDQLVLKKSLHPSMNLGETVMTDGVETQVVQRVRFSIQRQGMGEALGLMARGLPEVPKSIQELGLPAQVSKMVDVATSGLVIVTGPTGSGKSTTIAAILSKFNEARDSNVVTLEDPIEFQYTPNRCFFTQREIGVDVDSFEVGVIDAMRFALDILVIGEIRTAETMRAALRAAESGHLVLASTHAPNCVSAVRKMLAYLNNDSDAVALSNCLVGVIGQALLPALAGKELNGHHGTNGHAPAQPGKTNANQKHLAFELLVGGDKAVQQAIAEGSSGSGKELKNIEEKLGAGQLAECLPFISSLRKLVAEGKIDPRRAAAIVQSAEDRASFLRMPSAPSAPTAAAPPASNWRGRDGGLAVRRA